MLICFCAIGWQHSTFNRLFGCVFLVWRHHLRKVNKSSLRTFRRFFSAIFLSLMFLNIQINWIILKTYDQQLTLTTKKSLHIIFKWPITTPNHHNFGWPSVKRFALCYRTVVLSLCDVVVLWPNCWTDQDETWHADRPRPWPHCVRWGPSSPSPKWTAPKFWAPFYCGQTAGCIKMPLGVEVGLGLGHVVLDGDPAPLPKRGAPPIFGPCLL